MQNWFARWVWTSFSGAQKFRMKVESRMEGLVLSMAAHSRGWPVCRAVLWLGRGGSPCFMPLWEKRRFSSSLLTGFLTLFRVFIYVPNFKIPRTLSADSKPDWLEGSLRSHHCLATRPLPPLGWRLSTFLNSVRRGSPSNFLKFISPFWNYLEIL